MALDKIPFSMTDPDVLAAINTAASAAAATAKTEAVADAAAYTDNAIATSAGKLPGDIVQVVNTQTATTGSTNSIIPYDTSIPQITEGEEFMTRTITPMDALNILKVDVTINLAVSSSGHVIAALFKDSVANALAATAADAASNDLVPLTFTYFMVAGTTSPITFRVRAGRDSTGTLFFNLDAAAVKFGGVWFSSITVTEIKA